MGISLHEIRNPDGQLVSAAKGAKPPIKDIDSSATKVTHLDADKIDGRHWSDIETAINTKAAVVLNEAGKVKTINSVLPNASADIMIHGSGNIQVINDYSANSILISDAVTENGFKYVYFNEVPDGARTLFTFAEELDLEELSSDSFYVFYNGALLTPVTDYTLDSINNGLEFVQPLTSARLKVMVQGLTGSHDGWLKISPYEIDTTTPGQVTYYFSEDELSAERLLFFRNGMMQYAPDDYTWNAVTGAATIPDVTEDTRITIYGLLPGGGILQPSYFIELPDGMRQSFAYSGSFLTNSNALIWENGQLLATNGQDILVSSATKTVDFNLAPSTGAPLRIAKLVASSKLQYINGIGPDTAQNFNINPGTGIIVTPNPQDHSITVAVDEAIIPDVNDIINYVEHEIVVTNPATHVYTLPSVPRGTTFTLQFNGVGMRPGLGKDFTRDGATLTISTEWELAEEDVFFARYLAE